MSLTVFTAGMEELVFDGNRNRSGLTATGKTGNILKNESTSDLVQTVKNDGFFCSGVKAVCIVCIYTRVMRRGV